MPNPPLTVERLRDLIDYDPRTGLMTWKFSRGRLAKEGDEAGTVHKDGHVFIGIDGKIYAATRVVYFFMEGTWPPCRIRFRDGDPQNLRWNNLVRQDTVYHRSHRAHYQRQRARDLKVALAEIKADAYDRHRYETAPDAKAAHDILKTKLKEVIDNRIRNAAADARRRTEKPNPEDDDVV